MEQHQLWRGVFDLLFLRTGADGHTLLYLHYRIAVSAVLLGGEAFDRCVFFFNSWSPDRSFRR